MVVVVKPDTVLVRVVVALTLRVVDTVLVTLAIRVTGTTTILVVTLVA